MSTRSDAIAANDPTMDLQQAATFMHLGLEAMKKLVDSGDVPALSLNQKHTILLRDDLIDYVREQGRKQAEKRRKSKPAEIESKPPPGERRGPRQARPDLSGYELAATIGAQRG